MSLRQFPLRKTCQNLYFNLKNFKGSEKRPAFRSINHPFSTNTQLLNASYTNWLKESSRKLPSRIINHLQESDRGFRRAENDSKSPFEDIGRSSVYCSQFPMPNMYPSKVVVEDNTCFKPSREASKLLKEIKHFASRGEIEFVASKLEEGKNQHIYVDPESLIALIEQVIDNQPKRITSFNDCEVEQPVFSVGPFERNGPYYRHIEKDVKHIYKICEMYRHLCLSNKSFQEIYIRMCYHMDSMDPLQQMLYFYLNNKEYNPKVLGYVMSAFILNYEVEFSKSLFLNLLSLGRHLRSEFLECIMYRLVEVGALYENLLAFYGAWVESDICEKPSPKAMSYLLKEVLKYGNKTEIEELMGEIESLGLRNHFLISSSLLQHKVLKRSPHKNMKVFEGSDIKEFEAIAKEFRLNDDRKRLSDLYSILLSFSSKHCSLSMTQFFVSRMNDDRIELKESHYKSISNFYARNEKFLQAFAFLKNTSDKNHYQDYFLKVLFESFVRTYPYSALEFTERLQNWINSNTNFSNDRRNNLSKSLRVCKLESKLTPFNISRNLLNPKKYDTREWKKLEWKSKNSRKHIKHTEQVNFRVNKGFRDVLRKGVRPDLKVIEETFRRSSVDNRKKLRELLTALRMYDKSETRLELYDLQLNSNKESLSAYFKSSDTDSVSSSNLIFLSRISMNKGFHHETDELLSKVDENDISDRSAMVKLNIQLRNLVSSARYDDMVKVIENFPLNETVLSPYLYNQCCYIEKQLLKSLKRQKSDQEVTQTNKNLDSASVNSASRAVERLRGFIGDVIVRVEKDKIDLRKEVESMFEFLDKWIASNNTRDERKI